MGKSFSVIPSKHTQDWAVNNHMSQTGTKHLKGSLKFAKIGPLR